MLLPQWKINKQQKKNPTQNKTIQNYACVLSAPPGTDFAKLVQEVFQKSTPQAGRTFHAAAWFRVFWQRQHWHCTNTTGRTFLWHRRNQRLPGLCTKLSPPLTALFIFSRRARIVPAAPEELTPLPAGDPWLLVPGSEHPGVTPDTSSGEINSFHLGLRHQLITYIANRGLGFS